MSPKKHGGGAPEELRDVRKKTDRPMDRPLPFQVPAVATKISRFRLSAFRLGASLQGIPYVPGTLEWYRGPTPPMA